MTNLGEQVRQIRRAQGLSQAELARRSGTARVGITRLEQGQRSPTVEEAQALAQALGVSLVSLLSETEAEQDEGLELRFEVTVRLLPSREGQPSPEEIRELIETGGRLREPYEEKVKRVFGKDKRMTMPSKRAASAARKKGQKA
jgi:XRE family transcriptional regulator, regulator of sulfur utilization